MTGGPEPPVAPFGPAQAAEFHSIPRPVPVGGGAGSKASGAANGFLPCKRRESSENFVPRAAKVQCGNENGSSFDMFNSAIKDISVAYDKERQKINAQFQTDMTNKEAEHAMEIEKVKASSKEEVRALRAECVDLKQKYAVLAERFSGLTTRQAKDMEDYNRQLNAAKASAEAKYIKQIEQMTKDIEAEKKNWQIIDAKKTTEIETTNRWRREDIRRVEQQLDERQTKLNAQLVSHNELAVAQLAKTYDKRVEAIQAQCESECRAKLAEQKVVYERRIAELEAQLAAKSQDVELCNEIRKANELVPQLLDGISYATPQLVGFKNSVAEIVARAQDMNDHANRLQGFMTGWQMGMPRAPPMYFSPPSVPPPGSGGRGRRGAFQTESGPHHGAP